MDVEMTKEMKIQIQKDKLRSSLEQTIDSRVSRLLEVEHQWIIHNHYFAKASSECIELYRDGYFIAAVMMSHAINEAIINYVVERNTLIRTKSTGDTMAIMKMIGKLEKERIITSECAEASRKICGSYRNDVHHMNPTVANIDFCSLARDNLKRLAMVEKEIFKVDIIDGKMKPHKPIYWDLKENGTVEVFLRLL